MDYNQKNSSHISSQVNDPFLDVMRQVKANQPKNITLGDIYCVAMRNDGCAVLIASLAAVIILPIGALPGVPAIAGIVISLLYLGFMVSSFSPVLPSAISKIRVKPVLIMKVCCFMRGCLGKVSVYTREDRLQSFNCALSLRIIAMLGFVFSLATVVLGFIPFVPTLLMIPILLFSLGGIFKDGLFTAMGYLCAFVFLMFAIKAFI